VAAVGLTYWWSRPLVGRWGALLASALIALDPFYLALSRVLGHDALISTFMWLSLLAFLRVIHHRITPDEPNYGRNATRFVLISGAMAGFAFLSKYPALFIGAFIALAMLLVYTLGARSNQQTVSTGSEDHPSPFSGALKLWFRDMVLWTVAAGVVFVIFWPAMWVTPLEPVTAIINDALRASGGSHQKGSFFLGRPVPDPGVFFYPLVILLRTTPIIFFGLLVSLWFSLRQMAQRTSTAAANTTRAAQNLLPLVLLAYIVLYTLLVTYGGKKQDRYILPAFPAITMLAALGYIYISRFRLRYSPLNWILPVAILAIQMAIVWPYFPYYFSYYNPFAGGGKSAAGTIQVGWGEGLNEAAAYLNTLPNVESTRATSWYSTTFEPYFNGQAIYEVEEEKISRSAKPGLAADYVVFYINQVQRQLPSEGVLQYFQAIPPVHTVTFNGIEYAWVYPSVGMQHVFAGEVRLVGQAELAGYNLTDESGEPVTSAYPESVVFLSLFWEWQGKAEEDPIQISLVDKAGSTRGWGNRIETVAPRPYDEWQDGMIVRDDFALVIFAETPPGEYRLSVWIDRPATGETVGVFELGDEVTIPVVPR
jgi:hypothetical protein